MGMFVLIVDFELGQPQILNVLALVSDDIVEEEVEEHEELDAHLFEDHGAQEEELYLLIFCWEDVDQVLWADRGF